MKNLQKNIQTLIDSLVSEGSERGVQVVVYSHGKLVVDAWAGVADLKTGKPVDGDTLFPVFSTTKGIAATMLHLLAEKGKVDYDQPIASLWPEFAAHGKEKVTVRHALTHTSGIPQMPEGITLERVCDWDWMCAAIAQLKPQWEPGTVISYHAMTYGWIIGEICRRIDGRTFEQRLEEDIRRPLGIRDIYCGIPDSVENRVATLEEVLSAEQASAPIPNHATLTSVPMGIGPFAEWMNRSDARRACTPASSGIMSARACAKHYASLLKGGVDGVELLPPSRMKLAAEPYLPPSCKPEEGRGLGYGLNLGGFPGSFGHAGYGGSEAFAIPEHGLALCLTKNYFSPAGKLGETVFQEIRKEI